jgi:predicted MPP superfamily phosphohydrolase
MIVRALAALAALALWGLAWGWLEARSDPVVRRAGLQLADWPAGASPLRVALLSDIHAGTRSVTPERLARVVAQVNAERPDLVLIAGDFTPGHDPIGPGAVKRMLAPLAGLRARLGVIAVPGNHDHWTGLAAVRGALAGSGIQLLANQAVTRGSLVIGALDDDYSRHADLPALSAALQRLRGPRLILTHSPDVAPKLPANVGLLLAGHTHCGQAVIPWRGSVLPVSRFGDRYRCGIIRDGGRTLIVTAGIGTSGPPLRFNARPDWWLLTLSPRGPVPIQRR